MHYLLTLGGENALWQIGKILPYRQMRQKAFQEGTYGKRKGEEGGSIAIWEK